MSLQSSNPIAEILTTTSTHVKNMLESIYPGAEWPDCIKSTNLELADVTMPLHRVAAARKVPAPKFADEVTQKLNEKLKAADTHTIMKSVDSKNGYLNIFLDKSYVYQHVVKNVLHRATTFGHTESKKGKIAYVEHTSANPNAPLHIGNLRNVLIGAHVSNLLKAVGYDTKQLFYVNDLGYQIGLTVLGYMRIYHRIKPDRKLDQYIGVIYAIMNTLNELQKNGMDLLDVEEKVKGGYRTAEQFGLAKDKDAVKFVEWIDIYADLRERFYDLFMKLLDEVHHLDIAVESGKLNLAYEKNDPKTVKIFRRMVMDSLSGIQETLDTYRVRHDIWDFESELGWEGANERILTMIKNSPYYVPETQCNDKGVPEGSHLDFSKYIADAGLKTGKKGYQEDYPPLYILRPDGSTLYSFRDVVYSLKKCIEADLVLNVICSEQNLAQEKVALGVKLVKPDLERKQFHLTYDLVKLTSGRMSGRRARYLLADELYDDLKDVMLQIVMSKNKDLSPTEIQNITHEMATCAMKWTMLSASARTLVNFDINKAVSMEDASGPFVLYNSSRMNTLLLKFEAGVTAGLWKALPDVEHINFNVLGLDEWSLFIENVLMFPVMIMQAAMPDVPAEPALPEYGLHKTCDFLLNLTQQFSSFYNKTHVMVHADKAKNATPEELDAMYARIYLIKSLKTVLDNGLRLLMIEPLAKV